MKAKVTKKVVAPKKATPTKKATSSKLGNLKGGLGAYMQNKMAKKGK